MRAREFTTEAVLDPGGWGETPYGTDIDYFGLRVQMKPSTFLKLALPLGSAETNPEVEKHMRAGGKIAYPMLDIEIPKDWEDGDFSEPAKVVSHEGRNRMFNWIKLKGDDPIQVNIKPRGWHRRKHLTPDHIQALSNGLISQRGNVIPSPFEADTALEESELGEAEEGTAEAKEIVQTLTNAGYKQLGSGADATVWIREEGHVIKIIMPDSEDITEPARIFKKFYEFCQQHRDLDCLPRFTEIGGRHYSEFTLGGKQYMQIAMEQLYPIKHNTLAEGMVWYLSDFASNGKNMPWEKVKNFLSSAKAWYDSGHFTRYANQFSWKVMNMNQMTEAKYSLLYTVMSFLYQTGRINKFGWDLHTENVMQRKDGTLVITDPWFEDA